MGFVMRIPIRILKHSNVRGQNHNIYRLRSDPLTASVVIYTRRIRQKRIASEFGSPCIHALLYCIYLSKMHNEQYLYFCVSTAEYHNISNI